MAHNRYLVHFDDTSWGLYTYPLNMATVAPNPHRPVPLSELGRFRFARDTPEGVRIYGASRAFSKDGRFVASTDPILSWFEIGRQAAAPILVQSLPQYWLGRFRYDATSKSLRDAVTPLFSPSLYLKGRVADRQRLIQHSDSLKQKMWATRYHRGNLLGALERAKQHGDRFAMVAAGAEYAAFQHCLYSVLEEIAAVLHIFRGIQGLNRTPRSFHRLHSTAASLGGELGRILGKATWYEAFRLERANSAHAFGAVVHVPRDETDLYIWQHPDPTVYAEVELPPNLVQAEAHVAAVLRGSDELISDLCTYLLSMFHPWDTARLAHADPEQAESPNLTTVWVREISFSDGKKYASQSWALLDEAGIIRMKTDSVGGLIAVSPVEEPPAG